MPVPRLHIETALRPGIELALPASAARHVQVLRLQPGASLTLFDGSGGQWSAQVLRIGRREVMAQVLAHHDIDRELRCAVTLAVGMPANERMDMLVEKATELGAAAIQPLLCERSVLRLVGERAERKALHWHAIAIAACEQSGRNRLPLPCAVTPLRDWLARLETPAPAGQARLMLSLEPAARPLLSDAALAHATHITLLSGPEGGLSAAEQALAVEHGFSPVSLGRRVLRADTAPLAALACIAALEGPP